MEIIKGESNKILRSVSQVVSLKRKELYQIFNQMKEILEKAGGVGLAAPQVGLLYRLFIADLNLDNKIKIFINPEIINYSKETEVLEEGCLSLPGLWGLVERPKSITVVYRDLEGRKIKKKYSGLASRIIQHEIDHLDGILFIDKSRKLYHQPPVDSKQI